MTSNTPNCNMQQLCEHVHDWRTSEVEIDQARRLVRNIALTGRDSKNGYRYSEQALEQAVPLYENKPVFLDHAVSVSRPHERSARDLVGSIVNPRYEGGRVRSDVQLLDTEAGRTFLALSESKSPAVGMSHVVLAERGDDRAIVEKIHDVVSVDAVVFPATTSTFSESTQHPPITPLDGSLEAMMADIDLRLTDQVRQLIDAPEATVARRALFSECLVIDVRTSSSEEMQQRTIGWSISDGQIEFGSEVTPFDIEQLHETHWSSPLPNAQELHTELQQSTDENRQLREQLEQFQIDRRETEQQREIERLLTESNLPAAAVTEVFRSQLAAALDADSRRTLIEERKQLLSRPFQQRPYSRERDDNIDSELSDAAIIATLQHQRRSVLTGIA
ncbi:MAG: hypothetical protein HON53_17045 [Planctomycetaceae bacterium]|jgi:hypothetical protein|nr:hypothetical protein [Planctomycetaceae bacterium]MBT6153449.1 hypothetical protein [Planctomycetaceae bacterium]MBT6484719.1 hypothetical protein [Planctomycetaceae bacterium]MBT6496469.1 hypothetical protein [Planctomycetaceae bacterium]